MASIVWPPPMDSSCYKPNSSVIGTVIGMAIVFGQFLAFAPQLYSIIKKKHVEGINLLTYLLGTVSCTAVFFSGIVESWRSLFCCPHISPWHCMISLVSLMQVGVNWLNYFMIFCLLALYVKNSEHKPKAKLQFRLSLALYIAWFVIGGAIVTMTYLLLQGDETMAPRTTGIFNKFLGLVGIVTIILQWSPQIVTTFLHKGPGALSPITLSINAPGSMLTAFSQVADGKSFSIWMPYILSGSQQAIIVGIIIYFYCKKRRNNKNKSTIDDILDNDPGFQGPALLLEDSNSDTDDDLMSNQRPFSDNDFTSAAESEEYSEEDNADDEDSLIKRQRRRADHPAISSSDTSPL